MNPITEIIGDLVRKPTSKPAQRTVRPQVWQLNEAVNFDLETIFVAIPKTGSTSVRAQIQAKGPFLVPASHLNIVEIRDSLFTLLLRRAVGANDTFPNEKVISTADTKEQAKAVFDRFFKFSSVRNPWARAVSLYFRGEGVQVSDNMDFETFCLKHTLASDTCAWPTRHSNQIDWITDERGKILVDYVYRIEDFEQAVAEIRDLTGNRIRLSPVERNRNARSRSRDCREMFSDKSRIAIAKAFERDIDHFKYTF